MARKVAVVASVASPSSGKFLYKDKAAMWMVISLVLQKAQRKKANNMLSAQKTSEGRSKILV
jgi:hypothetical protein